MPLLCSMASIECYVSQVCALAPTDKSVLEGRWRHWYTDMDHWYTVTDVDLRKERAVGQILRELKVGREGFCSFSEPTIYLS